MRSYFSTGTNSLRCSASPWKNLALSPKVSNRFLHRAMLSSERSTTVISAPARAKLIESVPMPHPISSTFLPRHRSKSANAGMCGSTKYLRSSTSSKYSRVPTGLVEWRMLHGRRFQHARTWSMTEAFSTAADIASGPGAGRVRPHARQHLRQALVVVAQSKSDVGALVDRLGERRSLAELPRQVGMGLVVARKARAAIRHRTLEVAPSDAGVEPERGRDGVDVATWQLLAQGRDHVGERDPHRHVGVDRDLGQLGVDQAHSRDRRLVVADLRVDGGQLVAGALVELADQEKLGVEKVADDLAERD